MDRDEQRCGPYSTPILKKTSANLRFWKLFLFMRLFKAKVDAKFWAFLQPNLRLLNLVLTELRHPHESK